MSISIVALFDGEVPRPQQTLDLIPGQCYSVTIEVNPGSTVELSADGVDAWDILDSIAGTYDGPGDSSTEHDHYIYGTPKRADTK